LREKLIRWAKSKFGEISNRDIFNLKEEVGTDKKGNRIRNITMFLKKTEGIQQDWFKEDVFINWTAEIKSIVGDVLALKIFSSEGNEIQYLGGKDRAEKYEEMISKKYNYQFNLVIIKKLEN